MCFFVIGEVLVKAMYLVDVVCGGHCWDGMRHEM